MSAPRRLQAPDPHLLSTSTEATAMESGPHETRILRRHARDLTALLALPALWPGMTCLMTESGRRYGPAELALAEELARRAAL
jgi:hypothetical protein